MHTMPTQLEQVSDLIDHGRWHDAFVAASQLSETHPKKPRVQALLAQIGLGLGRPDITVAASRNLAALTEPSYWQLRRWAVAAARLDDASEVRAALSRLLRRQGTTAEQLCEHFELAARFHDERAMEAIRQRANGPDRAVLEAMALRAHGDSSGALQQLTKDLVAHPEHGPLWVERGRLRLAKGDAEGAQQDFGVALKLDPMTPRVRQLYNQASLSCGSTDDLAQHLLTELEGDQPLASVFSLRAEQLLAGSDDAAALKVINRGLVVYPTNVALRRSRPLALAGAGDLVAAISAAADLASVDATDAEALLVEAQVHRSAGTPGRQLKKLNQVFALHDLVPLATSAPDANLSPQFLRPATKPAISTMTDQISVIMTAFGMNDLLPGAIDSILAQTHESLELIVVDDCSPDGTFDYLQERARADERLRPLQTAKNGGTYRAKNLGLLHSQGAYIGFMDSDDYSVPQRIEAQLREFKKHPNLAIVSHGHLRVDENSNILFKRARALRMAHISPLVPRRVVDAVGFFDRVRVGADSEYIKRIETLFGSKNHLELESPLMVVASHAESLTGGGPFQMSWRGSFQVRMQYSSLFTDWHQKIRLGNALGYMPYDPPNRLFPAPDLMLS